ncbi:hypothetical protein R1sor_027458 [Riccia sorocarpa]|uniref:Cyclic nucleotide-binding domain-containing protein n=1 Tax=Riccia sorocarpa TaxID=122646 RepID=A0ABD3GHE8_9MARC
MDGMGLGVYATQEYHVVIISRMILKAVANPSESLWAPILAKVFFQVLADQLGAALCLKSFSAQVQHCPLVSLIFIAWQSFWGKFKWRPGDAKMIQAGGFKDQLFLIARGERDVTEATKVASKTFGWCASEGVDSIQKLRQLLTKPPQSFSSLNIRENSCWELRSRISHVIFVVEVWRISPTLSGSARGGTESGWRWGGNFRVGKPSGELGNAPRCSYVGASRF